MSVQSPPAGLPPLTDPEAAPTYGDSAFSRLCVGLLHDARDQVFIRLTLSMIVVMGALQAALWWALRSSIIPAWIIAAVYITLWAWFLSPVILMLHNTMHRPFLKRWKLLDKLHPFVMTFLFGIPVGYRDHHVGMHHAEDNMLEDLSSTIRYQRDSFAHFLVYFGRFFFLSMIELPLYLVKHNKAKLARRAVLGEVWHVAVIASAMWLDWRFGLIAFLVPYCTCRLLMMVGNWGQHAFINVHHKNNGIANAITCINNGYNRRCFNDGYHIGHHLQAARHWTEHPAELRKKAEKYASEGAIVFQGIDFFLVSVFLWTGRYDVLARRYVRLSGPKTDAEVEAMLRERVKPVAVWTDEAIGVGAT